MSQMDNPALAALAVQINPELVMAQVRIVRLPQGFELRHVADRDKADSELRPVAVRDLRDLAQTTAQGNFRPLKSAPTLLPGWSSRAANLAELDLALTHLYPGAVADWHAARTAPEPVTHYRELAGRQTGMYRVTQNLSDDQAARVARAVCHSRFCLKQRLWTVGSLTPDPAPDKSIVPCLEPCALLLEFARKAARWAQEENVPLQLRPSELDSLQHILRAALTSSLPTSIREAAFDEPLNLRRLQWILEGIPLQGE